MGAEDGEEVGVIRLRPAGIRRGAAHDRAEVAGRREAGERGDGVHEADLRRAGKRHRVDHPEAPARRDRGEVSKRLVVGGRDDAERVRREVAEDRLVMDREGLARRDRELDALRGVAVVPEPVDFELGGDDLTEERPRLDERVRADREPIEIVG